MYKSLFVCGMIKERDGLTDGMELHFLEVPKYQKKSNREMTKMERWLAYFANQLTREEWDDLAIRQKFLNRCA